MTGVVFSRKLCLCGGERLYAGWQGHGHKREGDEGFGESEGVAVYYVASPPRLRKSSDSRSPLSVSITTLQYPTYFPLAKESKRP